MTGISFLERINRKDILIADGATGTNLIARGLPGGLTPESWVIEQPEKIIQLHRDFIAAGADILLTSTFSASSIRLKGSHLEGKMEDVNHIAVDLARAAIARANVYVAGSLGPVGQLIKPYGPLDAGDVMQAYAQQARAISAAGADLLALETQFDLSEIKAAIEGIRTVSDLPLVVSLSYDRGRRTMMGVSPTHAGKELESLPVDVIGINCGRSLDENLQNLLELRQVTNKPIWFKPNAGLPHLDAQGITSYDVTPELMGSRVASWINGGAQIIGGCCGSSPEHLKEITRNAKLQ